MCKVASLTNHTLRDVAKMYGRTISQFGSVESGYRNISHSFTTSDGQNLNFILYKHEPHVIELIKRTNDFGQFMASRGVPARAPVDNRILQIGPRYGALYAYLPGMTISWEMYSMKHIKLLGYNLAKFHIASKHYHGPLPSVEAIYVNIFKKINRYFSDEHVISAIRHKLNLDISTPNFIPLIESLQQTSPRQALHMDFVRGNLLFQAPKDSNDYAIGNVSLSGILDLEKASYGNRVFDIARTLAFLLVDCPKSTQKIYKYFLQSGYIKYGKADFDPKLTTTLESLITMFLIYDFYKFLRQNPYESLVMNHHFQQTSQLLIERSVLRNKSKTDQP